MLLIIFISTPCINMACCDVVAAMRLVAVQQHSMLLAAVLVSAHNVVVESQRGQLLNGNYSGTSLPLMLRFAALLQAQGTCSAGAGRGGVHS